MSLKTSARHDLTAPPCSTDVGVLTNARLMSIWQDGARLTWDASHERLRGTAPRNGSHGTSARNESASAPRTLGPHLLAHEQHVGKRETRHGQRDEADHLRPDQDEALIEREQ